MGLVNFYMKGQFVGQSDETLLSNSVHKFSCTLDSSDIWL